SVQRTPSENQHAEHRRLVAAALTAPIGLPALIECVVPGDRVVIAVDPETPGWMEIVEQVTESLQLLGHGGVTITLLLPQDPSGDEWEPFLSGLPEQIRSALATRIHHPQDAEERGYLASSSGGERIYLNRQLLDADLIVTIGVIGFDSLLGYRGTSSVIFPSFSDEETIRETRVPGHPELTPDQKRPRRELVDEIGWLLGTQFTVQVLPDADGNIGRVLTGAPDQVQQAGQAELDQTWRISADDSFDLVLISVPGGVFGWKQLGCALETACRIVEPGGRVAIVADVPIPEGPGAQMLRRTQDPEDLLKPLRRDPPEDAVEISQLIHAQRRVRLFLFSGLATEVVEELGMFSISNADELQKIVEQSRSTAVIRGANFSWCDVMATH
ncbi:MAG: DUF2088 domain-containing protein, partial [Planctomycetaceae bacterium]|nr:DUF2088 domain-containing protein [Planctomycetaceae bacterium]